MDFYHNQKESTYLEQHCNFQMSGCKYSNTKLAKKPVSPCKDPVESFEYSSLFTSKTYSILSYIVGGFVGSKSQMNNNKHNLSFDLSAAIFNLLNPCKYEKEKNCFRKSNDSNFYSAPSKINPDCYEKYIVNRSSQRNEKVNDCIIGDIEMDWLEALPLSELMYQENYLLAFKEQCNGYPSTKTAEVNFSNSSNCDVKKKINKSNEYIVSCNNTKDEFKNIYSLPETEKCNCTTLLENEVQECMNDSEIFLDSDYESMKKEELLETNNSSILLGCENTKENIKNLEENTVVDSYLNVVNDCSSHSPNFLATERFRQQSECSVESTDSESFIVFDEHFDSEEHKKDSMTIGNDDFDNNDGNDEDSSSDEYDVYLVDKELAEANNKWLKSYQDIIPLDDNKTHRKVKFSDDVKVNKIVAWDYAYRAARPGPWEQIARDRVRFRERILRLSLIISPVLRIEHRDKIYKSFYC